MMGDFMSPRSFSTARCSRMRSFTVSMPKWSASSTFLAFFRLKLSFVYSFHGRSSIVSM